MPGFKKAGAYLDDPTAGVGIYYLLLIFILSSGTFPCLDVLFSGIEYIHNVIVDHHVLRSLIPNIE